MRTLVYFLVVALLQTFEMTSSAQGAVTYYATYTLNGGSATESGQTYTATATDTSGVWVTNGGNLTLVNPIITTSGNTSSVNDSSQYGLNAGVMADDGGVVIITGGTVTTTGKGANGLFATGTGAIVTMSNGTITTTAEAAHGVDVTYGGEIHLTNVDISTQGNGASAGLSTDYGGGTVTAVGGTVVTAGSKSPAIYSTGIVSVTDGILIANSGSGAVMDGANTILLTDSSLTGQTSGIKLHRTAKSSGTSIVTITGGSLTAVTGEAFLLVAKSGSLDAEITLQKGTVVNTGSGCLVNATSSSDVTFNADHVTLTGSLVSDETSAITANLTNGTLLTGQTTDAALTIDVNSTWIASEDSTLTTLTSTGTITVHSLTNPIEVTGNALLGGDMNIDLEDSPPAVGTYTLINAKSISGTFDHLTFDQPLPSDLDAILDYSSTTVTLVVEEASTSSTLPYPSGMAIDANDVLYVTDSSTNTIHTVGIDGDITLLAGSSGQAGTIDANATEALFNQPQALAVTSTGTVYVTDTANATLRQISNGEVTTLAGAANLRGNTDGMGANATFTRPIGLALDSAGNLYVADATNHTIRKISSAGVVTTWAGQAGITGSDDGIGTAAHFNYPTGLAFDSNDNLYVADTTNNTIRKITPEGVVNTLAGTVGCSGSTDGSGTEALFNRPTGLAVDSGDNLYVADTGNSAIRKISPEGIVTTFAGLPTIAGLLDATGTEALFNQPQALAFDSNDNLYVADTGNSTIRKITPEGIVTTLNGNSSSDSR